MILKGRAWIVVAAVGAVVALWVLRRDGGDADASGASAEQHAPSSAPAMTAAPTPMFARVPLPHLAPAAANSSAPATDHRGTAAEVVGPHADDPHEPGMRPHPMTDQHRRLYAENHLVQRLNDAMAAHDVPTMRTLVADYRRLDPADTDASQAGYSLIADCLERPGPEAVAAAQRFYDTSRHSPLRRPMRRICFENAD